MTKFQKTMKTQIELINKLEQETYNSLKDFQKATVDRIDFHFRNKETPQYRVLVADEVGMGKTMIAKGTIAKVAKIRLEEEDPLFKVIYICSNQAIAKQNIKTLDLLDTNPQVEDTRLSMQHLQVMLQENSDNVRKNYIQLIPLTPGTSFDTKGGGSVNERALICAVLELADEFKDNQYQLRRLFKWTAGSKSWKIQLKEKEDSLKRVIKSLSNQTVQLDNSKFKKNYPYNIIKTLRKESVVIDGKQQKLFTAINQTIRIIKKRNCYWKSKCKECAYNEDCKRGQIISEMRKVFARISTEMLNPDLIIMDEFQRFNSLIKLDKNSDAGLLAKQFLTDHAEDKKTRSRILLLSATPYKLFSTMEELNEGSDDDPYDEFFTVMNFLFEKNKEKFSSIWKEYSDALRAAQANGFQLLINKKKSAEDEMYNGVCRTERLSVMNGEDFIHVKGTLPEEYLKITKEDIKSYMQAQTLIMECGNSQTVPIDYIKSCPFLMSFMENYVLKKDIKKFFEKSGGHTIEIANKPLLWLSKEQIEKYAELPETNARLKMLKEIAFEDSAEKLLWCPPTKPYYELEGAYKGITNFSKTLIFSSWEMVPKMISTLLSYEEERKIRLWKGINIKKYSQYKHSSRLKLEIEKLGGKQLFSELYPSKYLASLYNPVASLNEHSTLETIRSELKKHIEDRLTILKTYEGAGEDSDWYFAALLLLDEKEYVNSWFTMINSFLKKVTIEESSEDNDEDAEDLYDEYYESDNEIDEKKSERQQSEIRYKRCITKVEEIYNTLNLGKQPSDLADFLVNVALGAFSTCYYRSCSKYENSIFNATEFGRMFIRNFNNPETMEVLDYVDQSSETEDTANYLSKVYNYCINGCFQGMLDEYIHLLYRGKDSFQDEIINNLALLDTASYEVDTFNAFSNEVSGKEKYRDLRIRMRSHYAVCFSKSTDKALGDRKENLRNAFNSPMRPFVLASTSVGQEGLDFHNYCRKIMHWNLPSNPIDLEQREGRINRYKCLSIRQNVAAIHGNINFSLNDTLWNQMFSEAKEKENGGKYSELIPFWVFGKNQTIKIERIVPIYPMSADITKYERLIKILSLYRMTLGQPRQEELLEYVFSNYDDNELNQINNLFIDLSPYSKLKSM